MSTFTFYLPELDNIYEQEAYYAYIKDLVEEFTQEEVLDKRIFRLIFKFEGILVVAQVGETCPVYKKPIYAIFETPHTFVVVSKDKIYCPLGVRKDEVLEIMEFATPETSSTY
ncbi:hypothetical protein [Adhaeribacter aquaticus]|uniref:hypothetical protein n=1 Tax=Adhaeribacter aquaticus TaxID=299567 RepID=UPI00040CEA21|nr:hypothetical protein [Adhaeribacter aquaticus]